MQGILDLGKEHLSEAVLLSQIEELEAQRNNIQVRINALKNDLAYTRGGKKLQCPHCNGQHPIRELTFDVYLGTCPGDGWDAVDWYEKDWGFTCLCGNSSYFARPIPEEVKDKYGYRKLFKEVKSRERRF